MDCREVEQLLPDYLQNSLDGEQTRAVGEHVSECAACGEEVRLWNELGAIPQEQPSPMMRRQFELMLEAYQQGRKTHARPSAGWLSGWFRSFVPAAAAAALLAVGFLAGLYVNRSNEDSNRLMAMQKELTSTKQLVALSMLQQDSASSRLEGVSWSTRLDTADPQVKDALLHTLRYDASVDVRMAALDALRRYTDQAPVRTSVEDSFRHQKSPLVQIALIDFMVEQHDRAAVEKLKNFRDTPDLNPTVRQRVEWGITQLSRS